MSARTKHAERGDVVTRLQIGKCCAELSHDLGASWRGLFFTHGGQKPIQVFSNVMSVERKSTGHRFLVNVNDGRRMPDRRVARPKAVPLRDFTTILQRSVPRCGIQRARAQPLSH